MPGKTIDPHTPRIGEVIDIDSHEMVPSHMWGDVFGEAGGAIHELHCAYFEAMAENSLDRAELDGDVASIDYENVWITKGPGAPSAIDLGRRTEVLDEMGISRQLVFPTFALFGIVLRYFDGAHELMRFDPALMPTAQRAEIGRAAIQEHNAWAAQITTSSGNRLRPVGIVCNDSLQMMMDDAEAAIDAGVRALMLPAAPPPGDSSPADPALDPFWHLLSQSDVPITLHVGTEYQFLASRRWHANVEAFAAASNSSAEFPVEPYRASMLHAAVENFLCTMVLGGVFERHPDLRFGAIEVGANWVGPLAERLDLWAQEFKRRLSSVLSMAPSEYLARNLRATPYFFEPVDTYYDKYPQMADVYCYSSDFPHREGGKESKRGFYERLQRFDDDTLDKFFRANGGALLPA